MLKKIILVVLLALAAIGVTHAQDSSWTITPGSFVGSDTAEIDTGIHVTFGMNDCIQVVITPGEKSSDVPRESKISIQYGNDRYSAILALKAGEQFSKCVSPMTMGLDDPGTGAIDYGNLFQYGMGEVRDILLHFQDENRSSRLVVTQIQVIKNAFVQAPVVSSSDLHWCKSLNSATSTESGLTVTFDLGFDLNNENSVVTFIDGTDFASVKPIWRGGNSFKVGDKFLKAHPTAVFARTWLLQYWGNC